MRRSIVIDLTGRRYGKLEVVGIDMDRCKGSSAYWICQCDCGGAKSIRGDVIRSGKVDHCGCSHGNRRHGKTGSAIHSIWQNMIRRCTQATTEGFENYGGRGVKVCERWMAFENFYADMGDRPEGMTLDRFPDVNGNYEPTNCRWATAEQQQNNRRDNRVIEIDGISKTLAEWCRQYGQSYPRVLARIDRHGWNAKDALTTPRVPDGKTREIWIAEGVWALQKESA